MVALHEHSAFHFLSAVSGEKVGSLNAADISPFPSVLRCIMM